MDTTSPDRRILLAVTGLTPQVVTETLYWLTQCQETPWIPNEVHILTTATGAENARLNLLLPDGWFHRLVTDYDLPPIRFPGENIHILENGDGQPLDDIRTPAQNETAADFITETVRRLTEDPHSELHVSIAGGRKTMGYYLGYALSLYGRPRDRLSHVLVSDPYESNRYFYYPTPYDYAIHTERGGKDLTVDAKNARVDLADIPFVRMRDGLPEKLRQGKFGFSRVVEVANHSQEEALLEISVPDGDVRVDGELLGLTAIEFAFVWWLAERTRNGDLVTNLNDPDTANEFFGFTAERLGQAAGLAESMDANMDRDWKETKLGVIGYFRPHVTRIKGKLVELLGNAASKRYAIRGETTGKSNLYFLPLEPEQIRIVHDRPRAPLSWLQGL